MPLYEYKCEDCGFVFDQLVSNSRVPNPSCPRWLRVKNDSWMEFFLAAEAAFDHGRKIKYPGSDQKVGPQDEHTITYTVEGSVESETLPLIKWIKRLSLITCGGKTKRLVSHSSFQLKGGGWAADGY